MSQTWQDKKGKSTWKTTYFIRGKPRIFYVVFPVDNVLEVLHTAVSRLWQVAPST